jgi:cell division protein FtsI (penicillin-binding protein 3)
MPAATVSAARKRTATRPATMKPAARTRSAVRRKVVRRSCRPGVRLRFGVVVICLALLALVSRLLWLQGFGASAYAAQAMQQRVRTTSLAPVRGEIVDRDGNVLAESVDARAVYADPKIVAEDGDAATEAAQLAPILGVTPAALVARMTLPGRFSYLAHGLTPAQGRQVDALDLPGIATLPEAKRIYPGGSLAADVLGFTNYDGTGVAGIEAAEQSLLAGKAGTSTVEVDPQGTVIPGGLDKTIEAEAGQTVTLTIDRDIQWEAQQAIAAQVAASHAQSGSVIVLDPKNGQVLADATAPTFDASDPGDAPAGDTGNRTVSDEYEPGSVNKMIVAAAALQERALTPTSVLTIPPSLRVADATFHDAEYHGTEHLTFTGILAKSSNIGAIEIAQRLGNATVSTFLHLFGFGAPTNVGLPGESAGNLPAVGTWGPTTAATIPFGQGMDVTAMQIAAAYGALANNGVYVQPSIVASTTAPDGTVTKARPPATHRVVDSSVAATLREMLEQVTTSNGTAPDAAIPGYRIAGKTGTANAIGSNGRYQAGAYTATFVGMAPADNPSLVVEVVLDKPQGDVYGGSVAGPVFQKVMSFALQSLKIPPSKTAAPVIPLGS